MSSEKVRDILGGFVRWNVPAHCVRPGIPCPCAVSAVLRVKPVCFCVLKQGPCDPLPTVRAVGPDQLNLLRLRVEGETCDYGSIRQRSGPA